MSNHKSICQAKTLSDILHILDIPPYAENCDDDEFPVESLLSFTFTDITEGFMFTKEQAKRIFDALEIIRKQRQKKVKGFPKLLQYFYSQTPIKKQSYLSHFEDLSNLQFFEGDDWAMDPCSAAASAVLDFVKKDYEVSRDRYDNHVNHDGWTPLMYACALGRDYIVDILLQGNPKTCAQNRSGQTPLMFAASYGHIKTIERLVRYAETKACDPTTVKDILGIDMADNMGFTALHHAVYFAQQWVVEFLLKLGSDPNKPDNHGMTPTLMACIDEAQEHCLPIILEYGGDLFMKNDEEQDGFEISGSENVRKIYAHHTSTTCDTASAHYGKF